MTGPGRAPGGPGSAGERGAPGAPGATAPSPGVLAGDLRRLTGAPAAGVWAGPGRVNLIGEHTDYNAGLALPFALDRRTTVAVGWRSDRRWRCWSRQQVERDGRPAPVEADLDDLGPGRPAGWARYVLGVAWALARAGIEVPGADLLVDSTVPPGSGLSSSAALTAAVAVALDDLTGSGLGPERLVAVCHDAEAGFVGAPTGTLDQRAVLLARPGHALLIDFAADTTIPVPLGRVGPLVVVDTGVRHDHAAGGYGDRRRDCEAAAAALGLADLRAADLAAVGAGLSGRLAARARHVVTENARVEQTVADLAAGRDIGYLLSASHRSLRDDFEVSCPELDAVVDAAERAGAAGARMTGGGFGGSAIVLGLPVEDARAAATEALVPFGRSPAVVFEAVPAGPAGRVA
ncbi:MAG TPA: galactokinase family protein [Acidimicrobiales bacterium]|nr:galactokinase family protein [Acidimicrobiales bacterium]